MGPPQGAGISFFRDAKMRVRLRLFRTRRVDSAAFSIGGAPILCTQERPECEAFPTFTGLVQCGKASPRLLKNAVEKEFWV